MEPRSILFVGADHVRRTSIRAVLAHAGFSVIDCSSEQRAVSHLDDPSLGLALLDWAPPDSGTIQLVEELQRRRPGMPVMFLADGPIAQQALSRLTAAPIIHNLSDVTSLVHTIERMLGLRS